MNSDNTATTTATTEKSLHELTLEILQATNDGNKLRPWQLDLLQTAINNKLTEDGERLFRLLYQVVQEGTQWQYFSLSTLVERLNNPDTPIPVIALHGVPHLDYDNRGNIYWKGMCVEHYTHPTSSEMADSARRLGQRCQHLEDLGIPLEYLSGCLFHYEEWFKPMGKNKKHPYKLFLAQLGEIRTNAEGHIAITCNISTTTVGQFERYGLIWNGQEWLKYKRFERSQESLYWEDMFDYHPMFKNGFETPDMGQGRYDKGSGGYVKALCNTTLNQIVPWLKQHNISRNLFDDLNQDLPLAEIVKRI